MLSLTFKDVEVDDVEVAAITGIDEAIVADVVVITAAEANPTNAAPSVGITADTTSTVGSLIGRLSSNTATREEDDTETCSSFVVDYKYCQKI